MLKPVRLQFETTHLTSSIILTVTHNAAFDNSTFPHQYYVVKQCCGA